MSLDLDVRRVIAYALAAASLATGHACAGNAPGDTPPTPGGSASPQSRVPGEYLVTVSAPDGVKAITDLYGRFGIKGIREIAPSLFLVTLSDDPGPATMDALRKGAAQIQAVEPNYRYRTQGIGTPR